MLMFSLFRVLAFVAARLPWMLNLATRVAARVLNMPEPMLHHAGAFVFAQVQAVENNIGERLRRCLDRKAGFRRR
jgi:hypothetical protein